MAGWGRKAGKERGGGQGADSTSLVDGVLLQTFSWVRVKVSMSWCCLAPWNKHCSEKSVGSRSMKPGSAVTDWPFEKGLAVSVLNLTSLHVAQPQHGEEMAEWARQRHSERFSRLFSSPRAPDSLGHPPAPSVAGLSPLGPQLLWGEENSF